MGGQTTTLGALGLTARDGRAARVGGLAVDSRRVAPGDLFAALPGQAVHGARHAAMAVDAGASAILTDRAGAEILAGTIAGRDIRIVVAEDPREALARAAALFYGLQPEICAAVTGTNGKTSVATFTRQIWMALGHEAINLGTTGVEGAFSAPLHHTTPEPVTLHRVLSEAAEAGVSHAAMEASSHGLDQRRLDGVRLTAAAFTNFSQDHLDYHESFEAYFAAKAGLFDRVLPEDGTAVIHVDDPKGAAMRSIAEARGQDVLPYGAGADAALRMTGHRYRPTGQTLRFSWNGSAHMVDLPLIGGFQSENVMAAAGLAIACGEEPGAVFGALPQLTGVRGRMQLAATRTNGAAVFVDYAHTPAALETALAALKPHVMGRIVVVYGAGGDRDRGKRPLMGAAARDGADVRIVTDDNPRGENSASIRSEILKSDPDALETGDRAEAILRGVDLLQPGDALLIAGKGHETGQIVGDTVYPFDDAEQASIAVAALDGQVT